MTKKEFDNYRFSIKTRIKIDGHWYKLTDVDFEDRWVGLDNGETLIWKWINEIKESK